MLVFFISYLHSKQSKRIISEFFTNREYRSRPRADKVLLWLCIGKEAPSTHFFFTREEKKKKKNLYCLERSFLILEKALYIYIFSILSNFSLSRFCRIVSIITSNPTFLPITFVLFWLNDAGHYFSRYTKRKKKKIENKNYITNDKQNTKLIK